MNQNWLVIVTTAGSNPINCDIWMVVWHGGILFDDGINGGINGVLADDDGDVVEQ